MNLNEWAWRTAYANHPTGVIVLPEGATYQEVERIRDEWVEITGFGTGKREYLLANDGRETAIEQAKTEYVYDRIDLDELEVRVAAALRGRLISHRAALDYYEAESLERIPVESEWR